ETISGLACCDVSCSHLTSASPLRRNRFSIHLLRLQMRSGRWGQWRAKEGCSTAMLQAGREAEEGVEERWEGEGLCTEDISPGLKPRLQERQSTGLLACSDQMPLGCHIPVTTRPFSTSAPPGAGATAAWSWSARVKPGTPWQEDHDRKENTRRDVDTRGQGQKPAGVFVPAWLFFMTKIERGCEPAQVAQL
ncbi:hypothetical protein KUCAC02_013096, partial [Chaenocephalus aceratus]